MSSKFFVLFGGLAACLLSVASAARADTIQAFGLTNTSLGNATLTQSGTGIVVGNLGSAGQDGVAIGLSGVQNPSQNSFSMNVSLDPPLGTGASNGSYIQSTVMGTLDGLSNQVISSITTTKMAGGIAQVTADFPGLAVGTPLTTDYYSGGADGALVYSETSAAPLLTFTMGNSPEVNSIGADSVYGSWVSAAVDALSPSSISTANGTYLPASDGIDFVDILAPANAQPQYTSMNLMAGGGNISSFTITGEVVTVPEPATLTLLGSALLGLGVVYLRRRKAKR